MIAREAKEEEEEEKITIWIRKADQTKRSSSPFQFKPLWISFWVCNFGDIINSIIIVLLTQWFWFWW